MAIRFNQDLLRGRAGPLVGLVAFPLSLLACSSTPASPPEDPSQIGVPAAEPSGDAPPTTSESPPATSDIAASAKQLKCEQRDDRWGCVDSEGKIVIPFEFISGSPFSSAGISVVLHPDKGFYYIDATGQFLYAAAPFDNAPDPVVAGRARFKQDGKVGFLNEDFTIAIPARYDSAMQFQDGSARVCVGCDPRVWNKDAPENLATGRVFHIDKQGNEVPSP